MTHTSETHTAASIYRHKVWRSCTQRFVLTGCITEANSDTLWIPKQSSFNQNNVPTQNNLFYIIAYDITEFIFKPTSRDNMMLQINIFHLHPTYSANI